MEGIDDLVGMMGGAKVDPNALGEHPRFSLYKNRSRLEMSQHKRREEAMERQRKRREDLHYNTRRLAELEIDDEASEFEHAEVDMEARQTELSEPEDLSVKKKRRGPRYAEQLMFSEWLVDCGEIPDFHEWIMVPSPVGKRVLVVALRQVTTVYNRAGKTITQFTSNLPSKGNNFTILDCILSEQDRSIYVLDCLAWGGQIYSDNPYEFRKFFVDCRLDEIPTKTRKNSYEIKKLPDCRCTKLDMEDFMQSKIGFPLDGLLFFHPHVLYQAGQTPLVGWLKPWMMPEILGITIPEFHLKEKPVELNSKQFIDDFNVKEQTKVHQYNEHREQKIQERLARASLTPGKSVPEDEMTS